MEPTGYISFTWPPEPYSRYNIQSYLNDSIYQNITSYNNYYTGSGLSEGDSMYVNVYGYIDDFLITPAHYSSEIKSVPVSNFGELNNFDVFVGFDFNDSPVSFYKNGLYYYSEIDYLNRLNNISLSIKNVRDGEIIENLNEEPLFTSIDYRFIANDQTLFSGVSFGNEIDFENIYSEHFISGEFILKDVHNHSTTGFIQFNNYPPFIESCAHSFEGYSDGYVDLSISLSTSLNNVSGYLYSVSDNVDHTNPFITGISTTKKFNIDYPTGQSGFLEVTPYNWNGSGLNYAYNKSLYYVNQVSIDSAGQSNHITNFTLSSDDQYIYNNFTFSNLNDIGSYGLISIDSDKSLAFSEHSYFTGTLDSLSSLEFEFFHNRTGEHDIFYSTIALHESGSNSLEDYLTRQITIPLPSISEKNLTFDYFHGYSELSFETSPSIENTGLVKLIYSGQNDTSFLDYHGDSIIAYSGYANYDFKFVNALDESIIYESGNIEGEVLPPELNINFNVEVSPQDTISYTLKNSNLVHNIVGIRERHKGVAVPISGNFSSSINSNFSFSEYKSYPHRETTLGNHLLYTDDTIQRNQRYNVEGNDYSGSYISGQYYMYHFEPYNAFQTGSGVFELFHFNNDSIVNVDVHRQDVIEGNVNDINYLLENELVNTNTTQTIFGQKTFDSDIYVTSGHKVILYDHSGSQDHASTVSYVDYTYNNILDQLNSQKIYTSRLPLSSGMDNVSIDYASLNFTGSPFVDPSIILPNIDSNFITASIYSVPTSNQVHVKFSNVIPQSGYFLDLMITDTDKKVLSIQPSPSPSPSPTPTPTVTPSITTSITPTSSLTPTVTPSITTSITPTSSLTPTVTPSITTSITPTSSLTPTVTPSITTSITPTSSLTPTVTPSITTSITPTSSLTPTVTPN